MVRRVARVAENRVVFWLALLSLLVWALPATRLVYNPQAVEIVGNDVTLYRSFPGDSLGLPRPRISYVETIRPLTQTHNAGHPCVEAGGPFRYSSASAIGNWSIEWAAPCLSDPQGYRWEAEWSWHIGAIKVGPVTLDHVALKPTQPGDR